MKWRKIITQHQADEQRDGHARKAQHHPVVLRGILGGGGLGDDLGARAHIVRRSARWIRGGRVSRKREASGIAHLTDAVGVRAAVADIERFGARIQA